MNLTPPGSINIWAGLTLFKLESSEEVAYMKLTLCISSSNGNLILDLLNGCKLLRVSVHHGPW